MSSRQKAAERNAAAEAEKERKRQEEEEKRSAAEWAVGTKSNAKQKALEDKDEEKRRKAAEKAALEAAEEEELSKVKVKKAPVKKNTKDDFSMLNAALASQPKTKAQKEAEAKQKALEERLKKEEEARQLKAAKAKAQEEEIRKAAAKGIVLNHTDDYMVKINNRLPDDEDDTIEASGFDAAVDAITTGIGKVTADDLHPEKRGKALYKAFYAVRLPQIKEELPGLKLSQYQERLFEEWKSHPDNPRNKKAARGDGTALGYDPSPDDNIEIEQYEL